MDFKSLLKTLVPAILMAVPGGQALAPIYLAAYSIAEDSKKPGAEKKIIGRRVLEVGITAANAISEIRSTGIALPVDEALALYDNITDDVINTVKYIQDISKPVELEQPSN